MKLSVVVVVHDMPHAARNTLRALAADYQRGIEADDYEVVVVDNGSTPPFDTAVVADLPGNFRCLRIADANPSPAPAVNRGVAAARGEVVGVVPDGARIATPGLLATALRAIGTHPRAAVTTVGWLLGRAANTKTRTADDAATAADAARILAAAGWPDDPDRLFEVSRLDGSMHWFGPGSETVALFLRRAVWDELGGMDERFDEPGGGFVCLDLYARLLALPQIEFILLLGEGTVHQPHGGVSTDMPPASLFPHVMRWFARYREITGHDLPLVTPDFTYFGRMPGPWRGQLAVWILRELFENCPPLAEARARLEARLAADPPERTLWAELHHYRDLLVEAEEAVAAARAAAAKSAAEAATARAALASMQATQSWRLTAPLRWAGALPRRRQRS